MPSRFVSLIILVYWSIAAFCLLAWDVIPELGAGYPPDLRSMAQAGGSTGSVRWNIQVLDDPRSPRSVGEARTTSICRPDGWFELTSEVEIDAGALLKGSSLMGGSSIRLDIESRYVVDKSGNLQTFTLDVKSHESPETLVQIKGRLKGRRMEIVSHGPVEMLNKRMDIDYAPRGLVQDVLGPLDRLPGLRLGQRWESQMVNPFLGKVTPVRVDVARNVMINWNGEPVQTFEVVQHTTPPIRTWVRKDGVILKQEVPLPLARPILLERRPEPTDIPSSSQTRVPAQ